MRSLTRLTVTEGYEGNTSGLRALRVGIDASIWFFHSGFSKGGENPELRMLFFRCCRQILAQNFLPVFVFDGPFRPDFKRGKAVFTASTHWLVDSIKDMLKSFGFEWIQVSYSDCFDYDLTKLSLSRLLERLKPNSPYCLNKAVSISFGPTTWTR